MKKDEDKLLLEQIAKANKRAFDTIFKKYYEQLVRFANGYMRDGADAEEIVQDVMVMLWEHASNLKIEVSVLAYLYTSVRNRALNAIKHEKVKQKHAEQTLANESSTSESEKKGVNHIYFQQQLIIALSVLPPKCRDIFEMAKFEGLSYDEIADYLKISAKTVENQMGIAMKKLREALLPYLEQIYET